MLIKDEDALNQDDILVEATVGSDGRYQASWVVRDVDSNDGKTLAMILTFIDPTIVAAQTLNSFLTTVEKNTVEIYAVFEGDETSKRSDTCVMEYITGPNYDGTGTTNQQEQKNCKNNILTISGLDNSASGILKSQVTGMILGGVGGANSDLLLSLLNGGSTGKITQSETVELTDILLSLDPIKEKTSGQSDMSLEEILNLMEDPTSMIEEKLNEKVEEKI